MPASIRRNLADALEVEPYDQQLVAAAIQAYADTGNQLVSHGQKAAMDFVSMLTPGERKMMATRLRQRDRHHHRNESSRPTPAGLPAAVRR